MSIAKSTLEEDAFKLGIAKELCFESGLLNNSGTIYPGQPEHAEYLALTNEILLRNPNAADNFRSREEMAEFIERAMQLGE